MADRRDWIRGVLIVALLMFGFAVKGVLIEPPSPPSRTAAGEFDTDRAMARLQRILGDQRPHPVDSEADDAVRGRLLMELQRMGLDPVVQDAADCSEYPKSRIVSCSRVRNVIVTIPSKAAGPHLLLNAHYDSTPTGPGAGDDGIGVATLLEVASILHDAPPARSVTLLFNEGEEFGLNGSSAFVRSPLAQHVNSLINIDARGVTGPAVMFETNEPNAAALSAYAQAARRPYANSLSTDFARLIPNTTDVVEFKPDGWTLLNFAIVGNETRYHSPGDTVGALDRASLYHVGSEVLALTSVMANRPDPSRAASGRSIFTDVAGRIFIKLPLVLAAALMVVLLIAGGAISRRDRALGRPLLLSAGMFVAGSVAAGFVAFLATLVRPGDFWRASPLVSYLAVYAVVLAAMTFVWGRWGSGLDRSRMRAAAWLLILIVGAALSLALPGALIFFLFGPAVALAGMALQRRSPSGARVLTIAAAAIQFVMFAELLALMEMLLIDGPLWAVAPIAALMSLPALIEIQSAQTRTALTLAAAMGLGLWIVALLLPRGSAERPASFNIDYFRRTDRGEAYWGIGTKEAPLPRGLKGEWHRGTLPYNGRERWIAKAPVLQTPNPSVRLIKAEGAGTGRRVWLALSPGGGDAVAIRFDESMQIVGLGLPGAVERVPSTGEPKKATLRCLGRSCDGFVIEAVFADKKPLKVELLSYRFGLPPEGSGLQQARPKNAIPQYSPDSTITLTRTML